jgi:hypothetical protein
MADVIGDHDEENMSSSDTDDCSDKESNTGRTK